MNISKLLYILLFFSINYTSALAQKISIKDNIAYIDNKPFLKVSDCGMYAEDCSISNLDGKEIISIDKLQNQSKPGTYLRVAFKGLNTTIEVNKSMKQLVEILQKNNAVDQNGNLIPENVALIKEKYGNRFSPKDSDDKFDND
jgi:hypothetical protein